MFLPFESLPFSRLIPSRFMRIPIRSRQTRCCCCCCWSATRRESYLFVPVHHFDQGDWCLLIASVFSVVLTTVIGRGKLELCDRCAGLGGAQCFVCKGTGVIYLEEGTKKCKACFGRGKILCRRCKGTGYSKMWF